MSSQLEQGAFLIDDGFLARYGKRKRETKPSTRATGPRGPRLPGVRRVAGPQTCETCGLYSRADIVSPKMMPSGQNKLNIVIVGEVPSDRDDAAGKPFSGDSGVLLRQALQTFEMSLNNDCIVINAIQCAPPSDLGKGKTQKFKHFAACCKARLHEQILAAKPKLIIALGATAARMVLEPSFTVSSEIVRGFSFPSHKFGCWVGCCVTPAYLLHDGGSDSKQWPLFVDDIARALEHYAGAIPPMLTTEGNTPLFNYDDACAFLKAAAVAKDPVHIDFETTGLEVLHPEAKIFCVTFAYTEDKGYFVPLEYGAYWTVEQKAEIYRLLRVFMQSPAPKTIQNRAMEETWSSRHLGVSIEGVIADTMISAHVIDERRSITGQEFQVFALTGDKYKSEVELKTFGAFGAYAPEPAVKYATLDSRYGIKMFRGQEAYFEKNPDLKLGAAFFSSRVSSLIRMEQTGIAIDHKLLAEKKGIAESEIKKCDTELQGSEFISLFRSHTGIEEFKPGSDDHVRALFWDVLDLPKPDWTTEGGELPTDKAAIEFVKKIVNDPKLTALCDTLARRNTYSTKLSTFINGFAKHIHPDGLMHPRFLLHFVETFRSSSSEPNWQNLPIRNEEQADFREVVIPHIGKLLLEADAKGSEVAAAAMLSGCVTMTKQIQQGVDMHQRWAARLFEVAEDKVQKSQRDKAKNKFVFPEFYGSYFGTIARDLNLSERHVKRVEDEFWQEYRELREWQKQTVKIYERYGYVTMPTGFRRHGPLSRNQLFNTPIQGVSFHMLLESIYRIDQDLLSRGMRSRQELEVHDSSVSDVVLEEHDDVVKIYKHRMTEKQWDWQRDVPRNVDMKEGPNWFKQSKLKL